MVRGPAEGTPIDVDGQKKDYGAAILTKSPAIEQIGRAPTHQPRPTSGPSQRQGGAVGNPISDGQKLDLMTETRCLQTDLLAAHRRIAFGPAPSSFCNTR